MALSLESLEALDAVEHKGNFTAAAHGLGKIPSAFTCVVRKLEGDLDVLLFDRRRHCAELTPASRTLLDEGRHLLQAADDLARRVKRLATGWEATLTIVVDDLMCFRVLIPVIQDSCAKNTATHLRFYREALAGTWDALLSGHADLLIGPAQVTQMQDIQTRTVGNIPSVSTVAAHHPLAQMEESLSAAAITRHRIVAVGDTLRNLPARTAGAIAGQDMLVVSSMTDKVQAQIRGLDCGWLPVSLAQPYLDSGVLIAKETTKDKHAVTFQIAWHNNMCSEALQWWVDKLGDPCLGWTPMMQ